MARRNNWCWAYFLALLVPSLSAYLPDAGADPLPVIVRQPVIAGKAPGYLEETFKLAVLRLAMEKSGQPFEMRQADLFLSQGRALVELEKGSGLVTVVATGTSPEREEKLGTVYFPIARGLLGYRVFFVDKRLQPEFSEIRQLADLRAFRAGQGTHWPDADILEAAGLPVLRAPHKSLYSMLALGRYDYFPRGIHEILSNMRDRASKYPNLVIERSIALYYKFPLFYFVNKKDQVLKQAIETGLETAFRDGSYIALFRNHQETKGAIEDLNMRGRLILELDNPLLTDRIRAIPEEYWERF